MILTDRKEDFFQNVTFCQDGCDYTGMNYSLMVANCLCDSHSLEIKEKNNSESINKKQNPPINFNSIKDHILVNLFEFNIDVMKCYNLVFNLKILIHNYGFYSMSIMFISQLIFLCIFFIKRLKPLELFMLKFNQRKSKNIIISIPHKSTKSITQNILSSNKEFALNPSTNEKIKNINTKKIKYKSNNKKKKVGLKLKKKKNKKNIIQDDNETTFEKTKKKLNISENDNEEKECTLNLLYYTLPGNK